MNRGGRLSLKKCWYNAAAIAGNPALVIETGAVAALRERNVVWLYSEGGITA